jgi:HK97 family phage portal protein
VRLKFNFREGLHLEKRVERRDWLSDGWSLPSRTPYWSTSGTFVDTASSLGLATASACIRIVSETIGMMPLKIYEGERPEVEEARDSWQWFRLKERPNEEQSAFDFWQDAAMSVEATGNAFIWKAIARRPVQDEGDIELFMLDPANVFLKRDPDTNRKYYEVRRSNGRTERVPASQILQIRGWATTPGSDLGVSPIALHRETLGAALAARQYQSNVYTTGGNFPGVIQVPDNPPQDALDRFQNELEQRHAGVNRPLVLTRGASWQTTGMTLRDAEYIEQQQFSGEEICRIWRVWPPMVGLLFGSAQRQPAQEDFQRFMQADMAPRLRRIEMALRRDADLFPAGGDLFPEFLTAAVLKPSLTSRFAAYKDARQGGWTTANEIRANENLPAIEGGDELQQTPVGGAPNEPAVTEAEQ